LEAFGWSEEIDIALITSQIGAISIKYESLPDSMKSDALLCKELSDNIRQIYDILETFVELETMNEIKDSLADVAWIWTESCFCKISQIAYESSHELEPILNVAPPDNIKPKLLLDAFNIQQ